MLASLTSMIAIDSDLIGLAGFAVVCLGVICVLIWLMVSDPDKRRGRDKAAQ